MAYDFTSLEAKWQEHWKTHNAFAALDPADAADMPQAYVLDMFPYPSGAGLHVGHALQQTATDILCRFMRMKGVNVLHPMGWDAFGLPAEQFAVKNNIHPAEATRQNVDNFRRQIQSLGMSYDWSREINTTDPAYYKWTQWIFLQIYGSYFDPIQQRAMPIGHLVNELQNTNYIITPGYDIALNPTAEGMEAITGQAGLVKLWHELNAEEQRIVIDNQRLAYTDEAPVNWCPGLGTVLANEEVVDGKSEVGGFPVERRPMRQWMLRITRYCDRLLEDLNAVKWPDSIKEMQRNWIGKSVGAEVEFEIVPSDDPTERRSDEAEAAEGMPVDAEDDDLSSIRPPMASSLFVFTTRPDTLFGATYMVLAPEHELVEQITTPARKEAVAAYVTLAKHKSDRDRMMESKEKSGVFTGAYAVNPVNDEKIPIWIADYVLAGYGTGAIMAVPAHDQRDFDFARKFDLPIVDVVEPRPGQLSGQASGVAYTDAGTSINSEFLNGLSTVEAKQHMIDWLESQGPGRARTTYKLRDWLFSRQRYWGEPFPIVWDEQGNHYALPEDHLPLTLPVMEDFKPTGTIDPPLSKAGDWLKVEIDGKTYRRETNTMPQWAGSCWYYLRYLDPRNAEQFVDREKEKYWLPVDLYVGGVEHAVLHLLYARFWHKVLHDLGHVSTIEPFKRLVNQGMIQGEAEYHFFEVDGTPVSIEEFDSIGEEATDAGVKLMGTHKPTGQRIAATQIFEELVERKGAAVTLRARPDVRVDARSFKMSKSRGNVLNPDTIVADYGADTFRLYEMYMGPLEAQKPWASRDIVGMQRFLNSVHRHFFGDAENNHAALPVIDGPAPEAIARQMHRTVKKVGDDIEALRFNVAIAELIKLNSEIGRLSEVPRQLAETFTLLLAPFAPHLAEELWQHLGHDKSLARAPWPSFDESQIAETSLDLPVQINGKIRGRVIVPADADETTVLNAAAAVENVHSLLHEKTVRKSVYVPGKLVNFVVS